MPTSPDTGPGARENIVEQARRAEYDLAVVGGGIAGAGVARDAAMRGLDVFLVEQKDVASGTTAWSTRLVHGGLRYLEQFDFGLVFESLQERETLADLAPHLVDPLEFLIPQYGESLPERLRVRLGMVLYDLLSYGKTMPWHDHLSASDLRALEPSLPAEGLQGGFRYHDRQVEFVERLCLETVLDAAAHGADVLTYAEATGVRTADGRVAGITVADHLGGATLDVDSRAVVNATGPWADELVSGDAPMVRPTKGIHLVVPSLTDHALTLPSTDGRVIFVVPWNGRSLVGTTDTDYEGDPGTARATADDVAYLLEEAGRYFPALDAGDVQFTYAGVRPLYDSDPTADASAVSRAHEVVHHDHAGLFSLVGAKITPFRRAAEDATDAVADHLGVDAPCRTADVALPGGRDGARATRDTDLPADTVAHLESLYGARADVVLARAAEEPRLAEPLCAHTQDILAQVAVAVETEYARRLTDVVFRRCTVGWAECEGRDAVEAAADEMARLLGWDDDRRRAELDRYEGVLERRHAYEEELAAP
ncbi:MAG: glycerol-3-phosphate dehydrogenase [Halorientalis sp.]